MTKRFQDSIRMTPGDKRRLLDEMDDSARSAAHDQSHDDRREHYRHAYRPAAVAVEVDHPGGGRSRYILGARNLSRQGVGLIHGGFLYDGAECTVVLETRQRELLAFPGKIVTCRHVDGTIHEIGVRFKHEIDVDTYFQLVEPVNLMAGAESSPRRELPPLVGRLLYIDPSIAACEQAQRYLADQEMSITTARFLGAGLDALRQESYDVVVCEATLDNVAIDEAVTKIRKAGHTGPIAFVTTMPDQPRDTELLRLGATEIALKPLSKLRLHDLLVRCLTPIEMDTAATNETAIQSHMNSMQRRIDELENAIISADIPTLRIACEALVNTSNTEGHKALSKITNEALITMQESGSTHAAIKAVERVAALAQSIQSQ